MTIKKAYQPIVAFLEENKNSKVSTILDAVIEMASAKTGGGTTGSNVLRNSDGDVVAVFCYYHKRYEPVADVEYGKKATSASGLNSMCKEGTSAWTKQQRIAKKAGEGLLNDLQKGDITVEDIEPLRAEIATAKAVIIPREDGIGFETLEEATAALL